MSTLLIDLDHTLLNNTAFKKALAESLELTPQDWSAAYEQFVQDNDTFEPEAFLAGVSPEQKKSFYHAVSLARRFLYADSLAFLEAAHEKNYKIVLVTFGNVAWQERKLAALHLPDYVKVLPTATTKIAVLADYIEPDTLLVDDNASEIKALVTKWPQVQAYWITRPEGKYREQTPVVPHTHITTLSEIKL